MAGESTAINALYNAPGWFLVLAIVVLGYLFLRSSNHNVRALNDTISELKSLIRKLFEKRELDVDRVSKIENRVTHVETSLTDCQKNRRKDDTK